MKCPDCKNGEIYAHVSGPNTHGFRWIECITCRGEGKVPDEYLQWHKIGREMRDKRVNGVKYRSLRDIAKRAGTSVVSVSAMERGKWWLVDEESREKIINAY